MAKLDSPMSRTGAAARPKVDSNRDAASTSTASSFPYFNLASERDSMPPKNGSFVQVVPGDGSVIVGFQPRWSSPTSTLFSIQQELEDPFGDDFSDIKLR